MNVFHWMAFHTAMEKIEISSYFTVAQWLWSSTYDFGLPLREPWVSLEYISGVSWPPTPEDIPDPSHGRVFREKFCSVYVVKGVWSLLTDLLLNRQNSNTEFTTWNEPKTTGMTTRLLLSWKYVQFYSFE